MDLKLLNEEQLQDYATVLESERDSWNTDNDPKDDILYQELLADLNNIYKEQERRKLNESTN